MTGLGTAPSKLVPVDPTGDYHHYDCSTATSMLVPVHPPGVILNHHHSHHCGRRHLFLIQLFDPGANVFISFMSVVV